MKFLRREKGRDSKGTSSLRRLQLSSVPVSRLGVFSRNREMRRILTDTTARARVQKARPPTEARTRTVRDFIRRPRIRLYERDFVRCYLHRYIANGENVNELRLLGLLGFIMVNLLYRIL